MTTKSIGFDIFAKDRASDKFDKVGRASSSAGDKLKTFAKVGVLAAGAAAAAAGVALFSMAKAAMADEKAQALLAKQLKNSAGATKGQIAQTEDWITKQGVALGVTDDDLRPALAKLVATTHDVSKAQGLASLAMNVSAGTGKSLSTVSAALAKAQLGNVSGLAKLGVQTKNADGSTRSLKDITEDLAKTYEGSAATAANTTEGKFGRLKLMFDETKESIGSKLLPVLSDMAGWFPSKGLPALQKFGGEISDKFGPVIGKLVGWFKDDLLPALKDAWDKYLPALQKAFDSVKKALSSAQPFFKLLGDVLVHVLLPVMSKVAQTALPLVGKALEIVGSMLGKVATFVRKLASAFLGMAEFGVKAFRLLLGAAFATFGGILDAAAAGMGWIPGLGGKIKAARDAFKEFGDKTIEKLKGVEQELHDTRDAINGIKSKTVTITVLKRGDGLGLAGAGGHEAVDPTTPRVAPGRTPRTAPGFGRTSERGGDPNAYNLSGSGANLLTSLVKGIDSKKVLLSTALGKVTTYIKAQTDKIRALMSKKMDLAGQFAGFTSSVFSQDMTNPDTGAGPNSSDLIAFQKAELAKALQVKADTAKLIKEGLSKDLIEQMASSGDSGIAQLHALASGSATDVKQLNTLNAQTEAALAAAGMSAGNAVFGDRIDQAKEAKNTALEIRKQLQLWRKQEDKNTVVELHIDGKVLHMSLLQLKRKNKTNLGLA